MPDVTPPPLASATSMNPAAGDYRVTADPREQSAAIRASERTLSAWSYYAQRYGDRGRDFARSDSGWIATLPGLAAESVLEQVRWLAGPAVGRGGGPFFIEQ